ncbi:MAG: hypothetical protein C5B49_02975 [Bdellovibrio sp.]|nr:MAG: hypothetical protein C5B49_02975 [Bdellovibrio sp.]
MTTVFSMGTLAGAAEYALDPAHTEVGFSVKHMMISNIKGRFAKVEGKFQFDEAKNDLSDVDVKVDVASISTNDVDRDNHLRTPDFFDAKSFPNMTFKSEKVEKVNGRPSKVTGKLTIRGKTNPVTFDVVEYNGPQPDPKGKVKYGFSLRGEINRKDFGINWNKTLDKGGVAVSDKVNIQIDGEAGKATLASAAKQ